jgi:hypothetical protein
MRARVTRARRLGIIEILPYNRRVGVHGMTQATKRPIARPKHSSFIHFELGKHCPLACFARVQSPSRAERSKQTSQARGFSAKCQLDDMYTREITSISTNQKGEKREPSYGEAGKRKKIEHK